VVPCGPALAMSLLGLSINAGLAIPMLGVAEQFFTSTISKVDGGGLSGLVFDIAQSLHTSCSPVVLRLPLFCSLMGELRL
jgi:hypothetical protein